MNRGMRILLAFALCSLVSLCKSYGGYSIPPIGKLSTNPSCGVSATAIFVAASGKSINVRNYVTEHNTSKSSHTIDEIVKMVSDQSIRVRPIKADVQSLFGVVQKPFIAHLSTKGLPGHFAVVFPSATNWTVLDPRLHAPIVVEKRDIRDVAFSGAWIIHNSDYSNFTGNHWATLIIVSVLIVGALLFLGSQALARTGTSGSMDSASSLISPLALLLTCSFFGGCQQKTSDSNIESTHTLTRPLAVDRKESMFESAKLVTLERVDFPKEIAEGEHSEVIAHLTNVSANSLSMENFVSGSPCCSTFVLRSLSSKSVEPGSTFSAHYIAYGRVDGMAETLEIQIAVGEDKQVIVAPSTIRLIRPAYRVLGPIDVDFGEINRGDDAVVSQNIIVRSTTESFLGKDAISILTGIGELTADVGEPEFIGVQLQNQQWNFPVTFRLNTERFEPGPFAYGCSGELNKQSFKIQVRGRIRAEWSLSGSRTPRILVKDGHVVPSLLRLTSSHTGYTIKSVEIANSSMITANIVESKVLQLSPQSNIPDSKVPHDEAATISLIVTPDTGSDLKLDFQATVSRR